MLRKLLILSIALTCGIISGALTLRIVRNSQTTTVPNLTGRTMASASTEAGQRRLRLKVTGRRNHPKISVGRVIEQEPFAGASIKEARTIRVVLSLGPLKTTVPDVRGQALRSARLRLEGMGVPVRRVIEAPSAAPEDTVLVQVPDAGVVENLGDGVLLVVARNGSLRDYVMPDLIGKSIDDISSAFESRGFVPPQIRYKSYPGLLRGTILSQSPLAGYRLNPRTAVIFEVSPGFMNRETVSKIRVRFAETDKFGYAYHGAYFAWFEVGRTDWLREHGLTYVDLMERGIHLPVVSTEARFLRPVAYDDRLDVRTHVGSFSGVRVSFVYELRREGETETLTHAQTEHAAVDGNGRLRRLPPEISRLLA